jgi:hypothetical protein
MAYSKGQGHRFVFTYCTYFTVCRSMSTYVKCVFVTLDVYSKTNEMHQFFKFILFCSSTLHVLDSLSVHHQASKTVHTASGISQTDSADCLLVGTRWNSLERPSIICRVLLQNKINLKNWCISLVLL